MLNNLPKRLVVQVILIYLVSFLLLNGCAMITQQPIPNVTVHTVDYKAQQYLPYEFKGEDPQTCQIRVRPKPRIPFTDPTMLDPICISPKDYLKVRHLLRNRCEQRRK